MKFDLFAVLIYWREFLDGVLTTLWISAVAALAGFVLAAALVCLQLLGGRPGRGLVGLWLLLMRGAPFIALVYCAHLLLPSLTGWRAPPVISGLIALTGYASAYYAEVIRGGILALPPGQWEAARVMGLSRVQAARHMIVPQLWKPALPSLVGTSITLTKESSVLSVLTVTELTYRGLVVQGSTYAPFEVFIISAALYWLITLGLTGLAAFAERHWLTGPPVDEGPRLSPIGQRFLTLRR